MLFATSTLSLAVKTFQKRSIGFRRSPSLASRMELTAEQKAILREVDIPCDGEGKVVLITAGAGTGKTTTLLELTKMYTEKLPEKRVVYLTFNKAAAHDAKQRLQAVVPDLDARTLHSCVTSLLDDARVDAFEKIHARFLDDDGLQKEIKRRAMPEIHSFLQEAYRTIEIEGKGKSPTHMQHRKDRALDQVLFFLGRTLTQFCRRNLPLEVLRDSRSSDWRRHYYPAVEYHGLCGNGRHSGFQHKYYGNRVGFYAETVAKLWDRLADIRTFDLETKRAQLKGLAVNGDVILADECQDLDECQVAFLTHQLTFGKEVYFVGDAAQSIYSFRGAKSENVYNTPCTRAYTLATSFRFGPSIARIANFVLYAKERSPQTIGKKRKSWQPYRVIGGGDKNGFVTANALDCWNDGPFTMIAFMNATLFINAVELIKKSMESRTSEYCNEMTGGMKQKGTNMAVAHSIPKFHINGKAEFSGILKWDAMVNEVKALYELFSKRYEKDYTMVLPRKLFPELKGKPLSWNEFEVMVVDRELSRFYASISALYAFNDRTLEAVTLFQEHVMKNRYPPEEADIILTTCHAAKGMEWDRVQICDDFVKFDRVREVPFDFRARVKREDKWQFNLKEYGDDINLLYVAVTRAKKVLSIPKGMIEFLQACDKVHEFTTGSSDESKETLLAFGETWSYRQAKELHRGLIEPLWEELAMGYDSTPLSKKFISVAPTAISSVSTPSINQMKPEADKPDGKPQHGRTSLSDI